MSIAVIADIYGNLLALEAVLADLKSRGVDLIVYLGDCASGPLWPRETMQRLARLGALTVRGNHDRQFRVLLGELFREIEAGHARQAHIRQHGVEAALREALKRRLGGGNRNGGVP